MKCSALVSPACARAIALASCWSASVIISPVWCERVKKGATRTRVGASAAVGPRAATLVFCAAPPQVWVGAEAAARRRRYLQTAPAAPSESARCREPPTRRTPRRGGRDVPPRRPSHSRPVRPIYLRNLGIGHTLDPRGAQSLESGLSPRKAMPWPPQAAVRALP